MNYRTFAMVLLCAGLVFAVGCGNGGPAPAPGPQTVAPVQATGHPIGTTEVNPAPTESYLKVWLDGQLAKRDTSKQTVTGASNWTITKPISRSPRLKYEITDSRRAGRLSAVDVAIFRRTNGKPAPQAEFSVYSSDAKVPAAIRPGAEYSLGNPGEKIGVLNSNNKTVEGVKLTPGESYMLVLIVKGDQSETAQIEFQTK